MGSQRFGHHWSDLACTHVRFAQAPAKPHLGPQWGCPDLSSATTMAVLTVPGKLLISQGRRFTELILRTWVLSGRWGGLPELPGTQSVPINQKRQECGLWMERGERASLQESMPGPQAATWKQAQVLAATREGRDGTQFSWSTGSPCSMGLPGHGTKQHHS